MVRAQRAYCTPTGSFRITQAMVSEDGAIWCAWGSGFRGWKPLEGRDEISGYELNLTHRRIPLSLSGGSDRAWASRERHFRKPAHRNLTDQIVASWCWRSEDEPSTILSGHLVNNAHSEAEVESYRTPFVNLEVSQIACSWQRRRFSGPITASLGQRMLTVGPADGALLFGSPGATKIWLFFQ